VDATIPCPGCHTKLNLSDTGCPVCLRARSPQEITRGYARVRAEDAQRKRRPIVVLGSLAAAAALGYGAFNFGSPLLALARRGMARFGLFYDQNSDPAYIAPNYSRPTGAEGTNSASAPAPVPATPATPPTPAPFVVPPAPAPTPAPPPPRATPKGPDPAAPEPPLPHSEPSQWILHGRVFDLETLQPIASIQLNVRFGESTVQTISADAAGYYAVVLQRQQSDSSAGYGLENGDSRYATAAQYEGDIPYRRLSAAERRQLIQNAQDNDVRPSPLVDIQGEEDLRRDVFLSPRQGAP
jgi:hypothetical protein